AVLEHEDREWARLGAVQEHRAADVPDGRQEAQDADREDGWGEQREQHAPVGPEPARAGHARALFELLANLQERRLEELRAERTVLERQRQRDVQEAAVQDAAERRA